MSTQNASSDRRLAVVRQGKGTPFVLIHGGHGSSHHWVRNIDALAAHFEVLAIDLPGYAHSPDVPKDITNAEYIDWASEEIDRLVGHSPGFHLAGFSFGSVMAAKVACRLAPRVARMTLLGLAGFGVPIGRRIPMQKLPEPSAPRQQRLAIAAANLGQWMLTRSPPADDPVIAGQLDDIDRTRFDSRRISLSTTMLQDLSALKLPLLLIWGAQDKLAHPTPQSRAALCRDVQPDAQIEILEGAGHWVQYEQAGAVNQLMLNFHRASD